MRKLKRILVITLVGMACFCLAEGTVTETWTTIGLPNKLTLSWTATTNGIASAALTKYIRGEICQFISVSTNVATSTYSVVLTNSAGIDLLRGLCTSLASNSTVAVCPGIWITDGVNSNVTRAVWNDLPTLSVSGLGTNCSGTIYLYWK